MRCAAASVSLSALRNELPRSRAVSMMHYEDRKRGRVCRGGVLKDAMSNNALQRSAFTSAHVTRNRFERPLNAALDG